MPTKESEIVNEMGGRPEPSHLREMRLGQSNNRQQTDDDDSQTDDDNSQNGSHRSVSNSEFSRQSRRDKHQSRSGTVGKFKSYSSCALLSNRGVFTAFFAS